MALVGSYFRGGRVFLGFAFACAVQLIPHTVQAAHAANDTAAQHAEPERDLWRYKIALGVSLAAGAGGWGTELSDIIQVYGRYRLYSGFGVGASHSWLTAPNNEGPVSWPEFHAEMLEGFAEYHPFEARWLDPFARAGVLGLTRVEGVEDANRLGLEGVLGLDIALPYFVVGLHARHGFTNQHWTMLGLQTEARF